MQQLFNPNGKCRGCSKYLSSEDRRGLCWRCMASDRAETALVFDSPTPDGERNLIEANARTVRLQAIFEGRIQ